MFKAEREEFKAKQQGNATTDTGWKENCMIAKTDIASNIGNVLLALRSDPQLCDVLAYDKCFTLRYW